MTDATTPEPQRVTVELHEHSGEYGAGCMGCGKRLIEAQARPAVAPEPDPARTVMDLLDGMVDTGRLGTLDLFPVTTTANLDGGTFEHVTLPPILAAAPAVASEGLRAAAEIKTALRKAYGWIINRDDARHEADNACAECVPDGPILVDGFRCVPHQAHAYAAAYEFGTTPAVARPNVLPADTVCACLDQTGERKVVLYDRCERCHAFMLHEPEQALASDAGSSVGALTEYGQCGWLGWTVEKWGRVTHKHACPNRTDPWCQTHPDKCAERQGEHTYTEVERLDRPGNRADAERQGES